ncbi:hypothetical protein GIB67_000161, partial [Kingdonia uniflora]
WELGNTPPQEFFLGWVWYRLRLNIFKFYLLFLPFGPRVSYGTLWIFCPSKPKNSTGCGSPSGICILILLES